MEVNTGHQVAFRKKTAAGMGRFQKSKKFLPRPMTLVPPPREPLRERQSLTSADDVDVNDGSADYVNVN